MAQRLWCACSTALPKHPIHWTISSQLSIWGHVHGVNGLRLIKYDHAQQPTPATGAYHLTPATDNVSKGCQMDENDGWSDGWPGWPQIFGRRAREAKPRGSRGPQRGEWPPPSQGLALVEPCHRVTKPSQRKKPRRGAKLLKVFGLALKWRHAHAHDVYVYTASTKPLVGGTPMSAVYIGESMDTPPMISGVPLISRPCLPSKFPQLLSSHGPLDRRSC